MSDKAGPADKTAKAWDAWTSGLPRETREALAYRLPDPLAAHQVDSVDEEGEAEYAAFRAGLPSDTQAALDDLGAVRDVEEAPNVRAAQYCLVVCPDGEYPTVVMYKTAEGMARQIGRLDGKDVVVWPFYGIPLPVTRGPQRYLFLQDGRTSIQVPQHDGAPICRVDVDLLTGLTMEEDGFLGPPELREPAMVEERLTGRTAEDDEVEDDDPEDEND